MTRNFYLSKNENSELTSGNLTSLRYSCIRDVIPILPRFRAESESISSQVHNLTILTAGSGAGVVLHSAKRKPVGRGSAG